MFFYNDDGNLVNHDGSAKIYLKVHIVGILCIILMSLVTVCYRRVVVGLTVRSRVLKKLIVAQ